MLGSMPLLVEPGMVAPQYFPAMGLGASEDGFVNFAVRVLRHHRAQRAVRPYGATTVANGEIAAGETIFVFD